jgi:hypothetical protein
MRLLIICLAALAATATPSLGAPIVLACHLESAEPSATLGFAAADQFLIDLDKGTVEMRVAETVGTTTPMTWTFTNRDDSMGHDRFTILSDSSGIRGAGILGASPQGFTLDPSGRLVWSTIAFGTVFSMTWTCSR